MQKYSDCHFNFGKFTILIKANKVECKNIGSKRVVILIITLINYNAHSIVVFSKCKDIAARCYAASRLFLINSNNNCRHNAANFDRIFLISRNLRLKCSYQSWSVCLKGMSQSWSVCLKAMNLTIMKFRFCILIKKYSGYRMLIFIAFFH